jgi:hypothetical protein
VRLEPTEPPDGGHEEGEDAEHGGQSSQEGEEEAGGHDTFS